MEGENLEHIDIDGNAVSRPRTMDRNREPSSSPDLVRDLPSHCSPKHPIPVRLRLPRRLVEVVHDRGRTIPRTRHERMAALLVGEDPPHTAQGRRWKRAEPGRYRLGRLRQIAAFAGNDASRI
jgi:hypothetical protein